MALKINTEIRNDTGPLMKADMVSVDDQTLDVVVDDIMDELEYAIHYEVSDEEADGELVVLRSEYEQAISVLNQKLNIAVSCLTGVKEALEDGNTDDAISILGQAILGIAELGNGG